MTKIAIYCAVSVCAFCASLLISPAILVYGVPFATGIASGIAELDCGLIAVAVLLFIGAVGLLQAHRDAAVEAGARWCD